MWNITNGKYSGESYNNIHVYYTIKKLKTQKRWSHSSENTTRFFVNIFALIRWCCLRKRKRSISLYRRLVSGQQCQPFKKKKHTQKVDRKVRTLITTMSMCIRFRVDGRHTNEAQLIIWVLVPYVVKRQTTPNSTSDQNGFNSYELYCYLSKFKHL